VAVRVFLDSCIVIYLVQAPSPFYEQTDAAFTHALQQQTRFCVTDLTRLECRVGPKLNNELELLAKFDEFFKQPEIEHKPLSQPVFDLATDLRAKYRLKTADALHLAAALHYDCDEFWTNDLRLTGMNDGELKIVVPLDAASD
jgi:predicted nucleic acid-binding protein